MVKNGPENSAPHKGGHNHDNSNSQHPGDIHFHPPRYLFPDAPWARSTGNEKCYHRMQELTISKISENVNPVFKNLSFPCPDPVTPSQRRAISWNGSPSSRARDLRSSSRVRLVPSFLTSLIVLSATTKIWSFFGSRKRLARAFSSCLLTAM